MAIGDSAIRVEGVNAALKELNDEIERMNKRSLKGLIAGGIVLLGEAQNRAPVDTGNLRSSGFVVWGRSSRSEPEFRGPDGAIRSIEHQTVVAQRQRGLRRNVPEVEVGFSAAYALPVHEDTQATHIVGQAKFLEDAAGQAQGRILKAVRGRL